MPQIRPPLRPPLTTSELSAQQRSLVDLMREHQFGRIENMPIQAGQPILAQGVKVVRVVRLSGESGPNLGPSADQYELKGSIRNLFDELQRVRNGTVISLEFRHGLPWLLETRIHVISGTDP